MNMLSGPSTPEYRAKLAAAYKEIGQKMKKKNVLTNRLKAGMFLFLIGCILFGGAVVAIVFLYKGFVLDWTRVLILIVCVVFICVGCFLSVLGKILFSDANKKLLEMRRQEEQEIKLSVEENFRRSREWYSRNR